MFQPNLIKADQINVLRICILGRVLSLLAAPPLHFPTTFIRAIRIKTSSKLITWIDYHEIMSRCSGYPEDEPTDTGDVLVTPCSPIVRLTFDLLSIFVKSVLIWEGLKVTTMKNIVKTSLGVSLVECWFQYSVFYQLLASIIIYYFYSTGNKMHWF